MKYSPEEKDELIDPRSYARPTCSLCKGNGYLRIHVRNPMTGKVVPKDNNTELKTCGCALKRYMKRHNNLR